MFVPSFAVLIRAILLVGALWWCKVIFGRLPEDVARLRQSDDRAEKGVVIFIWALTVLIAVLVVRFVLLMIASILSAF